MCRDVRGVEGMWGVRGCARMYVRGMRGCEVCVEGSVQGECWEVWESVRGMGRIERRA